MGRFSRWWEQEGSGGPEVRRLCRIAWSNGEYVAVDELQRLRAKMIYNGICPDCVVALETYGDHWYCTECEKHHGAED